MCRLTSCLIEEVYKYKDVSGPSLVSRPGDAGWSEHEFKVSNYSLNDPTKSVNKFRQLEGGHGSWNPLRSV